MDFFAQFMNQISLWIFASLMIVAAWSDAIDFTIPNRVIVSLLVLYPAYVLSAPHSVDWPMALAIAACVLVVGFILYSTAKLGAGDVKLIAVTSLWAGTEYALDFVLLTAIAGGAVSLVLILRNKYGWVIGRPPKEETQNLIPYGIAIAAGGLFVSTKLIVNAQPI
jgi:prepilin peptidase CpaA